VRCKTARVCGEGGRSLERGGISQAGDEVCLTAAGARQLTAERTQGAEVLIGTPTPRSKCKSHDLMGVSKLPSAGKGSNPAGCRPTAEAGLVWSQLM
jgi:hypothetical protein